MIAAVICFAVIAVSLSVSLQGAYNRIEQLERDLDELRRGRVLPVDVAANRSRFDGRWN